MFKKCIQIRIGTPQISAFPGNPVGAISRGRKLLFDHPGFRVHTVNHARRRHSHPQLTVTPFLTVRAGSECIGRCLRGLGRLRFGGCSRSFGERAASSRRIPRGLINYAGARSEVASQRLACFCIGTDDLAIVGRAYPERFAIEGNAATAIGAGRKAADELSVLVADQICFVVALVENPQAILCCLQTVRLRSG